MESQNPSQESERWVSSQSSTGPELVLNRRDMELMDIQEEDFAFEKSKQEREREASPLRTPRAARAPGLKHDAASPRQRLTATHLAIYHHLECDLYLHLAYRAQAPSGRPSLPVTQVALAQFEKGDTWERILLESLEQRHVLTRVDDQGVMSGDEIAQLFAEVASMDEDTYISGLSFMPPSFEDEFAAHGTRPVHFSQAKPDLIKLRRGQPTSLPRRHSRGPRTSLANPRDIIFWEVIDAKSSSRVKTSHHVQIGFYARCLQEMLPDELDGVRFASDTASIWLPPLGSSLQSIPLAHIFSALEDLIFRRLPEIVHGPEAKVQWHFNPLCSSCPWMQRCRTNATRQKRLGLVPNISPEEAVLIQSVLPQSRTTTDIEELDRLFASPDRLQELQRERPTAMRRIQRRFGIDAVTTTSPVLEAARTGDAKVTGKRTLSFPRGEDVAVVVGLALDASSHYHEHRVDVFPAKGVTVPVVPHTESLLRNLAAVISTIHTARPDARVQFYTFSRMEQAALNQFLVDHALSTEFSADTSVVDDLRACISVLCDGASTVATAFQPIILQEALADWLGKASAFKKKNELQEILRRLHLSPDGKVADLRARLDQFLEELKATAASRPGSGGGLVNSLPRVVVLQEELERLIAIPSPGFWELPQAAEKLINWGAPSQEEITELINSGDSSAVRDGLAARNDACNKLVRSVRRRIGELTDPAAILLNDSRPLPINSFMDLIGDQTLRKLFWMQQFEAFSRLHELWTQRRDGNPGALLVKFVKSRKADANEVYLFETSHAIVDVAAEREFGFYDWLLVEDSEASVDEAPTEILFDDLLFSGVPFGLPNKGLWETWKSQLPITNGKIAVANISNVESSRNSRLLVVQVYPRPRSPFKAGQTYRLTPRLVDFNSSKIMRALLAMDMETTPPPFLSFLHDAASFARSFTTFGDESDLAAETKLHSAMSELRNQNVIAAGSLMLKDSQRKATRRLIRSPLSVIHGPPGTGKTYTLALSLLRMLEASYAVRRKSINRVIFITAFTHAAIDAFLNKLDVVTEAYRQLPDSYETRWLDHLATCHVKQGGTQQKLKTGAVHIYLGTAYQLDNFARKFSLFADAVFVDEASQMSVGIASLVLRWLRRDQCKIVCAGDHLQLGTIMAAAYPKTSPPLFSSLLDFVIGAEQQYHGQHESDPHSQDSNATGSTAETSPVVQITENWRLNADLTAFVSQIYSRRMTSVKKSTQRTGTALRSLRTEVQNEPLAAFLVALGKAMMPKSKGVVDAPSSLQFTPPKRPYEWQGDESDSNHLPNSLSLLRLRVGGSSATNASSYEAHVRLEADIAARLVHLARRALGPQATIFVATPHRVQRTSVKEALRAMRDLDAEDDADDLADRIASVRLDGKNPVRVDTIERLQGQEADIVICCFAHTHRATLMQHLPFLFQRRRLNVGISRAKVLCIVLSSVDVLRPPLEMLSNTDSVEGYAFLRAYEDRAWSGQFDM